MIMEKATEIRTGIFDSTPVQGLEYQTQTFSGMTDEHGAFHYRCGETVTFSIRGLVLGSALGTALLTPAHLVIEVGGDIKKISNRKVTNLARFVQSLNSATNIERSIIITDVIRNCIGKYRYDVCFDQSEETFGLSAEALFAEIGTRLRSGAEARNHLRRALLGIRKMTDVKVPTRDGAYVLADVYRPAKKGKYPVIMSFGGYGKAFWFGCIGSQKDLLKHEEMEDAYFEGIKVETPFIQFHCQIAGKIPPSQLPPSGSPQNPALPHVSEHFELANTADWVPNGYVVIRIDGRGTGKTPGMFEQFSLQEAQDYYDAIEWAAQTSWSNGNVGLYGASYYAMNALNVASLQPPSLKAMMPIAGDIDSYRDYVYSGGGLYNEFGFIAKICCDEWQGIDWLNIAKANQFYDPAVYGPNGSICISPDPDKIIVPFWDVMNLEMPVHTRGSSEAFIHSASQNKKLTILSETGIHFWMYAPEFVREHIAFFDYWLKGVDNGIMDRPTVRMMVRTGWGSYYWQNEAEWPLQRTQYEKYYLNVATAGLHMGKSIPTSEESATYAAGETKGVSFLTDFMSEDILIAGYAKLGLWVASTSYDMAIQAVIRVMDENNKEVPYAIESSTSRAFAGGNVYPMAQGALKVSHRKQDIEKTTIYRPYYTHLKEDYQPLTSGEIVECEVEIWPTTAVIKKGWRIRLDLQPSFDSLDATYQKEALNTIFTGAMHPSYLQLPIIPQK